MYTDKDFADTKRQLWLHIAMLAGILLIWAGLLAWTLIARYRVACWAFTALGACVVYYFITMKLVPWIAYWRYMRDMRAGRSRVTEGWFVSMTDEARIADGVMFHEFILRIGDKEEDERLFFFDADKKLPELAVDQKLRITSFGNYITELEFL